jgi:outer membrane murein-binding lipoprotein Lpp
MFEHWHQRHDEWRDHPTSLVALDLLLEILLMTIAELNAKVDTIKTGVDDLKAQIAALKNQPPGPATQEDLDQLGAKLDAVQASISA